MNEIIILLLRKTFVLLLYLLLISFLQQYLKFLIDITGFIMNNIGLKDNPFYTKGN